MASPILFCRVGWMDRYSGPEPDISGAGAGQAIGNEWEAFNFAPFEGKVFGYCSGGPRTRTIEISRLGAHGGSVSGVTVVWIATCPRQGGQKIVGWYLDATVHRNLHPSPTGRPCHVSNGQRVEYNVEASAENATLLLQGQRTFNVPRARGFMGQSNIGYMQSSDSAHLVAEVRRYIATYHSALEFRSPDEVPVGTYVEGATKRITVNAIERDPRARRACIEHFGAWCFVCGLELAAMYGSVAEGLIHVHHLSPLAAHGRSREVDPLRDLRPICPNCHAVIHMRDPPYTIEDVRAMLRRGNHAG